MSRGFFGIGVVNIKNGANMGAIMRGAYNFKADFVVMTGRRYKKVPTDVQKTWKHVPLFDGVEFSAIPLPKDCQLIGVELCEGAVPLETFSHPERALYMLGPEDGSLPQAIKDQCRTILKIDSNRCLNVAMAATVVMYDRQLKKAGLLDNCQ